jgi:hypothetical protein
MRLVVPTSRALAGAAGLALLGASQPVRPAASPGPDLPAGSAAYPMARPDP